jgi:hypothetical protein
MACAAIPMTIVMVLQAILMLIGVGVFGDGDGDVDVDVDTDYDALVDANSVTGVHGVHHDFQKIITVRGIVAFFALGGWAGLAALSLGLSPLFAIPISLIVGAVAMSVASFVIRMALRMQQSGNLDIKNALSHEAEVYIKIPASQAGVGKITMVLQERFVEINAVTDHEEELTSKTKVTVVKIIDKDCVVVRPV